ncbi:hypothetical protein MMC08_000105 [Hypocenomyce scalaris]|nr:hypothetical protein [Hypocenomyce scalaris]
MVVSVAGNAAAVTIGTFTTSLTASAKPTPTSEALSPATLNSQIVTPAQHTRMPSDPHTLTPDTEITVSDSAISISYGASAAGAGTSTAATLTTLLGLTLVDTHRYSASQFTFGCQILAHGDPAITASGAVLLSLASNAGAFISGANTMPLANLPPSRLPPLQPSEFGRER